MLNAQPLRCSAPEVVLHFIKLTGVNGGNPTKDYGPGVTVTRTGEGLYRVLFADAQGTFLGAWLSFGMDTPAAGGGKLAYVDRNSATSTGFDFAVEDPGTEAVAPVLDDIVATESLYIMVAYKRTAV